MNYYQFHVGDYAAHTRNLGLLEDLAYRRLLDAYYVNERPFVGNVQDVAREIGMREHVEDVEYVLNRFFARDGDAWTNKRADAEIEKFKGKSANAAKAGRASAERRLNERSTFVGKDATDVQQENSEKQRNTGFDASTEQTLNERSASVGKDATDVPTDVGKDATDVQPTNNQEPIIKTIPPSPPSGVARPKREKPRTRCRPDFVPSEAGVSAARANGLDVQAELRRFIDHHTAHGSTMADWQAAWRTWCGRAVEFGRAKPQNAAGMRCGSDEYLEANREATWWREAGFANVWEAANARCWHTNAHLFHAGKRAEVTV